MTRRRCLVLFDGAGFARLGLERAGFDCLGVELDPWKHALSQSIGSGNVVQADVTAFVTPALLADVDAVWASPPCQWHSVARTQGVPLSPYATDLMEWALGLAVPTLWVENVLPGYVGVVPNRDGSHGVISSAEFDWCAVYNAGQFTPEPRQNRNRCVGGHYPPPRAYRAWRKAYPGVCPTVTATEYKGCATDTRRASRFYGRRLRLEEAAYHQGLDTIPAAWFDLGAQLVASGTLSPYDRHGLKTKACPSGPCDACAFTGRLMIDDGERRPWTAGRWTQNLYEAIGNAVPVYMAYAFGMTALRGG